MMDLWKINTFVRPRQTSDEILLPARKATKVEGLKMEFLTSPDRFSCTTEGGEFMTAVIW